MREFVRCRVLCATKEDYTRLPGTGRDQNLQIWIETIELNYPFDSFQRSNSM